MAEIEDQVRLLAERRFARTAAVPTDRARAAAFFEPPRDERTEEPVVLDLDVERPAPTSRSPMRFAIAAAVVLIAGIGAAVFFAARSEDPLTPVSSQFTVEHAFDITDAYFTAHEAGDLEAVLELFTGDATFSDTYGLSDTSEPEALPDWKPRLAWDLAQGETLISPECELVDEVPGATVTIACDHGTLDAVVTAVASPTIPTTSTFTITPTGISDLREDYTFPDFATTGVRFSRWMDEHHPEFADASGCCGGDTVEESVARGEVRAQYAKEWAAYLEANNCSYAQAC